MTDPVEITQHATQAQQAGGVVAGLGALGIAATSPLPDGVHFSAAALVQLGHNLATDIITQGV